MEFRGISYAKIPHASRLFVDYLYNFKKVSSSYAHHPFEWESYRAVADHLPFIDKRGRELGEILERQNREFGAGDATFSNIRRLSRKGTFAVVTGQQVGLFSGPAFSLYKALTTIRLAHYLSERGIPSVPVFWAATQDHDLEEVNSCHLLDKKGEPVGITLAADRPAPRCPVGRVRISPDIKDALVRIGELLPEGPARDRVLEDLEDCYQPGEGWGRAFCRFMARLFGRWGVVFVDPLDQAFPKMAAGVYQRAYDRAGHLRGQLQRRGAALVHDGYHAQVRVHDDSTLLFALIDGDRVPVRQKGRELFVDHDRRLEEGDLRRWIERAPEDFSPNVLLRPIVQDSLLPTVAYVAGPSELAYLGQAQVLYTEFGCSQPVIFPRAAFTLVDHRSRRWLEKYGLDVEQVWRGEEHLASRIAASGLTPGWGERFEKRKQAVEQTLEGLRRDIEVLDPTLVEALSHAKDKVIYQLDRLQGKLERSALQRSENLGRHAAILNRFLFPHRNLQEREISGIYFLGHAGYELLDRIYERIQVHSSDHQLLPFAPVPHDVRVQPAR